MFPGIRNGLATTMDMFANWWRSRAVRHSGIPAVVVAPEPTRALHDDEDPNEAHVEEALRRFLSYVLDGEASPAEDPDFDPDGHPLVASATRALATLEVQARYLPRRPSLLPKLMSAINGDGNSMQQLAAIIGEDPALLGNLLRVANSAFYRVTDRPIESLERAVVRVGTDGIRSLVATALLHPVMSRGSGPFAGFADRIWEYTQIAADAAELHAKRIERSDAFAARLLALLQGLAMNAVFRIVRDEALAQHEEGAKPAMIHLIERWTMPIARRIAANWQLPAGLQQALESSPPEYAMARSAHFGKVAGSQVLMAKYGRIQQASARATVLASDSRRAQVNHVWVRLAVAFLQHETAADASAGRLHARQ
jgi:HD-like signal output (HDOD) protein